MSSPYTPPPELEEFLNGTPPIYIGFGSIIVDDPKKLTLLLLEAVQLAGVRAIISQGWGELGSEDLVIPPNVHLIGNCPHDWIFKKVSCVVHHGGAGTTAAAMATGKPSIVVPFFGDQPFWGEMIAKIGAGPKPIPFKKLTAPDLAAAIGAALEPDIKQRAKELGEQIRKESGVDAGVTSFHHHLEHSNLGCAIASSHPAAWKIRGTNIQLGSGAVALLVNRGLLGTDKIELFRPQKYDLNIGPRDPFSGMAFAFIDSTSEIGGGLNHFGASTKELFRLTLEKPFVHSGKRSAFASSLKGIGKASVNVVRTPVDIAYAFTQGLHNAPKLWGDHHVELPETIEGIPSGLTAAGKELVFGVYNGVSSLILFPRESTDHRNKLDILTGIGFGTASCITKSVSGLTAIITYPLKGVDVELTRALSTRKLTALETELLSQGSRDTAHINEEYIKVVLDRWKVITRDVRKGKLRKRRYHWPRIGRGHKPVRSKESN
ncbi:uncharacterized protein N7443_003611 [Penicillium atrosanguineum]|uniref:uncharacterized protein n=1 Tax=Penicillium atrosanguineum TaxID=1132637 RepID=UPI00238D98B3|nr:uncharacterized protein N7443_003611 [Penicillium atrosanguineum]KAJ5303951.1 hypothetical protein N7443_003611 [Penicillium atrosanguineum]